MVPGVQGTARDFIMKISMAAISKIITENYTRNYTVLIGFLNPVSTGVFDSNKNIFRFNLNHSLRMLVF